MRIAIDATPLLLRSAGVKSYLYHWIRHLRLLAGEDSVATVPVRMRLGELDHERSLAGAFPTAVGLALFHLANRFDVPVLDWLVSDADVFHASHLVRRPPGRPKLTATLYDMTPWILPETHRPANVAAVKAFAESVVPRASALIAISESTRSDSVRILGVPADRIDVIYPGVPESFFAPAPDAVRRVRERFHLARPYVLFVGTVEPRKNLGTLLEAYGGLPPSVREAFELVVAGPVGWRHDSVVDRLRSGRDGVRFVGYVPEPDLPGLTAGATIFAYPSLYEGFGLPVAQAMASGVPVITSNVSSLPEIAGDAAMLVDPRSVTDLRAGLERLLDSPALREHLRAAGMRRAGELFTWDRCARLSLRFFESVAGAG